MTPIRRAEEIEELRQKIAGQTILDVVPDELEDVLTIKLSNGVLVISSWGDFGQESSITWEVKEEEQS